MKPPPTLWFNLVAPGSGLIVLRREWLGLTLSFLFVLLAQIGVVGLLLWPATIPNRLARVAAVLAAVIWSGSQWLLLRRRRSATGDAAEREIRLLCQRASDALGGGRLAEAGDWLRAALKINDEHLLANRKWAELAARTGRTHEAVGAWRRVLQLERDPVARIEAGSAIEKLTKSSGAWEMPIPSSGVRRSENTATDEKTRKRNPKDG